MTTTIHFATEILKELDRTINLIDQNDADQLADKIIASGKIFVAGAGRSGFMGKSFAMRLMHMGIDAFVVGETVTPSLSSEDLLIIASGSGETKGLVSMAEKAKSLNGSVALVTVSPESTIGKLSDLIVKIPAKPKAGADEEYKTIQPMGSLFEQTLLLFFDSIILKVMEKKELSGGVMYGRHANLE